MQKEKQEAGPFKAMLLDEADVLLQVVTLAGERELTPRHVDLRPHGGDCDREPGRYRWDRENQTLVPLTHGRARRVENGLAPDLETAFCSLLDELERQGIKLNDRLMVWRAGYRNSVDYLGAKR